MVKIWKKLLRCFRPQKNKNSSKILHVWTYYDYKKSRKTSVGFYVVWAYYIYPKSRKTSVDFMLFEPIQRVKKQEQQIWHCFSIITQKNEVTHVYLSVTNVLWTFTETHTSMCLCWNWYVCHYIGHAETHEYVLHECHDMGHVARDTYEYELHVCHGKGHAPRHIYEYVLYECHADNYELLEVKF